MVSLALNTRRPEDRVLPQGRLSGPMPWIIAIMTFLTVLACAAGLALQQGAATLADAVANRLTVQLVEADAGDREAAVRRIVRELGGMGSVKRVSAVPRDVLVEQLEPWLGRDAGTADIPIPALIDVDLAVSGPEGEAAAQDIARRVKAISAKAEMQAHAAYLRPVATLVRTIGGIAFAIVALMAIATGCAVVLAARAAHATHRGTIDIMHMLGATDRQVMRLFQRRMTLDVSFGALIGLAVALPVIFLVGRSLSLIASGLINSAGLPGWGWSVLPLLPLGFVGLAWVAARLTLRNALSRSL
jgi:cell division transport system permease protein